MGTLLFGVAAWDAPTFAGVAVVLALRRWPRAFCPHAAPQASAPPTPSAPNNSH